MSNSAGVPDPREALLRARLDPRVHGPRTAPDTPIALPPPEASHPHSFEQALGASRLERDPLTGQFTTTKEH